MTRFSERRGPTGTAAGSAAIAASPDLIGPGETFGATFSGWSGEAWLPQRLSVRAALAVYVISALIGWAGIVGLAYGVRAALDEAGAAFTLTTTNAD